MVFETPCGLVCKSSFAQRKRLFCGEEEWSLETKHPLIPCCEAGNCDKTPKMLGVCSAFETSRKWNYEESCEKKQDLYNERKNRALREFVSDFIAAKGFVPCPRQLGYDGEKWTWQNNPLICVESCKRKGTMIEERFCPMMEKTLSKKTGNLYFDIRVKETVFRDIRIHHKPFLLDIAYYMWNHRELISKYLEQIAWIYLHNHKINENDYTICNIRVKEENISQLKKTSKQSRKEISYGRIQCKVDANAF